MADLVGTCQSIIGLSFKIKDMVATFHTNQEVCDRIRMLVDTVEAVVEPLKQTQPNKGMSAALKGLEKTLERSLGVVKTCQKKCIIRSCIEANGITKDLLQASVDISVNVGLVNLANNIDNRLLLTGIMESLAELDATSLEIIDAHLQQEDSSHRSNPASGAGSIRNMENKIKKLCGPNTTGSNKIEITNVPADSNGSHASLPYAKSTSLKSVDGQGHPRMVNKKISRSTENMTWVTSIDVHPAKPWIVTGHMGGNVSIWDYKKQKTVMEKLVTKKPSSIANLWHTCSQYIKEKAAKHWVCSVKFITQRKWLAVGDGSGYIHVYDYTNTELSEVEKFKVHDGTSVDLLAVHPTETYLLSSSAYGRMIKLWDWSSGWEKIQEFDVKATYPHGVLSLKFNPRDTNTFACVTDDESVKVWNIESSRLTTELVGPSKADYFFTRNDQHLMVTLSSRSHNAKIQDLETGEVVHILGMSGQRTMLVAGHPTLPILVTALDDGTVCFWDANTYRLENKVRISDESTHHLTLVTDVNDITRLVVTSKSMIVIMEVNLPKAITSERTGGGNYR